MKKNKNRKKKQLKKTNKIKKFYKYKEIFFTKKEHKRVTCSKSASKFQIKTHKQLIRRQQVFRFFYFIQVFIKFVPQFLLLTLNMCLFDGVLFFALRVLSYVYCRHVSCNCSFTYLFTCSLNYFTFILNNICLSF